MSTVPPSLPPQNPGVPAKKTSPLVWILGGVVVLMFGVMLTCAVGGFLAYRAVKNVTGFDPDLMQRNPGLAIAKMAGALHPNYEIVSTDERNGKITMREKGSGKVMTFKFDPDKKMLVMIDEETGNQVKITSTGDGSTGTLTAQSADGTVKYGVGTAKAPDWVPVYPGASMASTISAQGPQGDQNSFTFKTGDAASKVIAFYQEQLKSGGFTVTQMTSDQGGLVTGETADKKRSITVTVGSSGSGTEGSILTVEKK
jgi:hypothetical protein